MDQNYLVFQLWSAYYVPGKDTNQTSNNTVKILFVSTGGLHFSLKELRKQKDKEKANWII